jgi:hypothetical protein
MVFAAERPLPDAYFAFEAAQTPIPKTTAQKKKPAYSGLSSLQHLL